METSVGFDFPEYPRSVYVFVLRTTLEGTKQGAAGWQNYSRDILEGLCGLKSVPQDPAVFYGEDSEGFFLCSTHSDDFCVVFTSQRLRDLVFSTMNQFVKLRNDGPLVHHLGVDILRDPESGVMKLHQQQYVLDVVEKFKHYGLAVRVTPMAKGQVIPRGQLASPEDRLAGDALPIKQILGALLWLAQNRRPDIKLAVHLMAQYCGCPIPAHFDLLLDILGYLWGTSGYGLVYVDPRNISYHSFYGGFRGEWGIPDVWGDNLTAFCDSDWANCTESRRSRGAYIFFFKGALISCHARP